MATTPTDAALLVGTSLFLTGLAVAGIVATVVCIRMLTRRDVW
jgi:hypothetical protein